MAASLSFAVLLSLFFAAVLSGVSGAGGSSRFGPYDMHLHQLLVAYRGAMATRLLWVASLLAEPTAVIGLALLAGVALLVWGKRVYSLLLLVAVFSGVGLQALLAEVLPRSGPPAAGALIRVEGASSLLSSHAAGSLVFLGVVAFVGLRLLPCSLGRAAALLAALAALLVGLAAAYLGVSWPSGVLASWCLGAAWLSLVLGAFLVWERWVGITSFERRPGNPLSFRTSLGIFIIGLALSTALIAAEADPLLAQTAPSQPLRALAPRVGANGLPTISGEELAFVPRYSETLGGAHQEPVSLLFLGTRAQLVAAFARAGWHVADAPTPQHLIREVVAGITNRAYPAAPVTPSFVQGRVQDVAFELPDASGTFRRRHHCRWWSTPATQAGMRVWVGTASFDAGLEIATTVPLPTHRIDPDIDAERDYIARSLTARSLVAVSGRVCVSGPMTGRNAAGDRFFTDGKAIVLVRNH